MKKFLLFLFLLDLGSKIIANQWIPPMEPLSRGYPFGGIPIFHTSFITFSLNYIVNTGAAWGFFTGHPTFLFWLRSAIILGFASYLLLSRKGKEQPLFPSWLIIVGAIGNGVDYLLYGHVIDFLHFTFWGHSFPIFNLADSYITLGVLGFVLSRPAQKTVQFL